MPILSAGTQIASSGTAILSNSNGVSFGMSNSSAVTASYNPVAISGAGNSVSAGTVVFSNSNNVSFGMAGSTVTATISTPLVISAFVAGTQTQTSGTEVLSNSNGVSFGMSGSSQITASFDGLRSVSAGISSGSFTGITFSDSTNVSFGLNAGKITATVNSVGSFTRFPQGPAGLATMTLNMNTTAGDLSFARFLLPFAMSATRLDYFGSLSVNGSQGSSTMSVGLYTRSGNTINSASSTAAVASWDATTTASAASNYGGQSGWNVRSVALGTWNMTPGEYWIGFIHLGLGTGGSANISVTALGSNILSLADVGSSVAGVSNILNLPQISCADQAAEASMPINRNMTAMNFSFNKGFPFFHMYGTH